MHASLSRHNAISTLSLGLPKKFFLSLLLLYTSAHFGLFLISDAIYWDDWLLVPLSSKDVLSTFEQAGSMFNMAGHLHVGMVSVGPWAYRFLTFALGLYGAILFWHILAKHEWVGTTGRGLAVIFFAVSPLFAAKVALINFPYTLCLFLFLLGWALIQRSRVFALILFFVSFNTNSLLVLFALPMLDVLLRENAFYSIRAMFSWCRRWSAFLLIPFVFWYIKKTYFAPYGLYEGYNEKFALVHLSTAPLETIADFLTLEVSLPLLLLFFFVLAYLYKHAALDTEHNLRFNLRIFCAGTIAVLLAVFPYWILGYVPTFYEWTSRHQLLLPLGVSLIFLFILNSVPATFRGAVATLIIALSLAQNVHVYTEFADDWNKQKSIISQLATVSDVRDASLIVFDDTTDNARRRVYRFYEWNGLLTKAFGANSRFGINVSELKAYRSGEYDNFFTSMYLSGSHVRSDASKAIFVRIKSNSEAGWRSLSRRRYSLEVAPLADSGAQ